MHISWQKSLVHTNKRFLILSCRHTLIRILSSQLNSLLRQFNLVRLTMFKWNDRSFCEQLLKKVVMPTYLLNILIKTYLISFLFFYKKIRVYLIQFKKFQLHFFPLFLSPQQNVCGHRSSAATIDREAAKNFQTAVTNIIIHDS